MKLKLMMATLVAAFSVNAMAGLMIEPYVGTGQYATTFDAASLSSSEESGKSFTTAGARLGYSMLLFSAGIDYEMMNLDGDNLNNVNAFVGVDLPVLLRFYGKYTLSSSFDNDDLNDIEFKSGYAVGAGFTGLPFVVINLEVGAYTYTFDGTALSLSNEEELSAATTALTVSLPLP